MRGSRVKQLVGKERGGAKRRAIKKAYKLKKSDAGASVARPWGPEGGKMPPTGWHKSSPKHHPLRAIGEFFMDMTDRGKQAAVRLLLEVGKMPRWKISVAIENLRKHVGVKQYEEVRQ